MGAPEYRLLLPAPARAPASCGRLRSLAPAPLAERRRFAGPLATVMVLLPRFRLLDSASPRPAVLRERHDLLRLPASVIGRLSPGHALEAHESAIAEALAPLRRAARLPARPWAVARLSRYGLDLEFELWSAAPGTRACTRLQRLDHSADGAQVERLRLSA